MMKLTGKKLILLLLYSPTVGDEVNVPIAGRTRLMKMGFLFSKELLSFFQKDRAFDESELPEYFGWKYGPFSVQLVNDLEFLVNRGYVGQCEKAAMDSDLAVTEAELREWEYDFWVEDTNEFQSREYDEEVFELTSNLGLAKGSEIWEELTRNQQRCISEFKKSLNRAPLSRILEYIYKKYHKNGYIDRSLIRERYLS